MKCDTCGSVTHTVIGDFNLAELGVPGVILKGIKMVTCDHCHTSDPVIPRLDDLMRTIAAAFLAKPTRLAGSEVKFLRTRAEMTQAQLAELLHVDRTTITKWETGEWPLPASTDVAIRSVLRLLDETLRTPAATVASQLKAIDDSTAAPLHLEIDAATLHAPA